MVIHVVLFPSYFHVAVTFKNRYDNHFGFPARSRRCFTVSAVTAQFAQKSPHRRARADFRLVRCRFGFVFITAASGARIFS